MPLIANDCMNMNRTCFLKMRLTLCAATVALICGCAHEGAYAPKNTTRNSVESSTEFVLLDPGAQRSVTCSGIQQRVLADGRLEVAANVRNRENRRIEVQINCVFKDEQGFAVDETPFQTLILTENATESVRFASMNAKAKKYTIIIRQAR